MSAFVIFRLRGLLRRRVGRFQALPKPFAGHAARADFTRSAIAAKAAESRAARSARTFRSISIPAFFRPSTNLLYDSPKPRTAALMRTIHSDLKLRLRTFRSRYA